MFKKHKLKNFNNIKNIILGKILIFIEIIGFKVISKWRWEKHELEYNLKKLF